MVAVPMPVRAQRRSRLAQTLQLTFGMAVGLRLLALVPTFVSPRSAQAPSGGLRGGRAQTARFAEGEEGKDDGGFLKFLKVEQDIELSPEEYQLALEQEIESQRKRYYINGEIKPNNLVVPWKPVDERQLDGDARRQLKKNGIIDPAGGDVQIRTSDEDSLIDIQLVGEQDVRIDWTGGAPGTKVGYIIERKPAAATNFVEIASFENSATAYLLAQPYAGHEYSHNDELVKPGTYNYRVLVRVRSGEISVVDQKDIVVPELGGVDSGLALIVFLVFALGTLGGAYLYDPVVS
eukprot:CAMPEP_0197872646 /NCGR_PEP_ID=MMETSP1439-20131203/2681_1 /TAXON_ID=66791 /ORGANISM="Gonyaulax spinifera, Strain CCMP409" /LENGTH=291 /DNA_ID=CAMNT_0043491649 /DNA_START=60 /DNA_END=935 /DNA_ORIENTATION=+